MSHDAMYKLMFNCTNPEWARLLSSCFRKGVFVRLEYDVMSPVFGEIINLITVENVLILCVLQLSSQLYVPHFNAFIVKNRGNQSAIDIYSLPDHRPFYANLNYQSGDSNNYVHFITLLLLKHNNNYCNLLLSLNPYFSY